MARQQPVRLTAVVIVFFFFFVVAQILVDRAFTLVERKASALGALLAAQVALVRRAHSGPRIVELIAAAVPVLESVPIHAIGRRVADRNAGPAGRRWIGIFIASGLMDIFLGRGSAGRKEQLATSPGDGVDAQLAGDPLPDAEGRSGLGRRWRRRRERRRRMGARAHVLMDRPDDASRDDGRPSVAVGQGIRRRRAGTEDERLLTGLVAAGRRIGTSSAPPERVARGCGALPAGAEEEVGRRGPAVHFGEEEERGADDGEGEREVIAGPRSGLIYVA